jgi:hypothetical protein
VFIVIVVVVVTVACPGYPDHGSCDRQEYMDLVREEEEGRGRDQIGRNVGSPLGRERLYGKGEPHWSDWTNERASTGA